MAVYGGPDIVTDGLVLHLDAANTKSYPGSGSVWYDLSSNKNNGTLINEPTFNSANKGSISFDGTNDYVVVDHDSSLNDNNSATILCWAKSDSTTWSNYGFLMSKRNRFVLHPQLNSRTVNGYFNFTGNWVRVDVTPPDITEWVMYTMSVGEGQHKAYWNNNVTSVTRSGTLSSSTNSLWIGYDGGTRYLNGNIAISMIYNRQLSDDEVFQNYDAFKGRFGL
jgi:hypothetical protein